MIKLRQIEHSDLDTLKNWRNSPDVFNYVREYRYLNDNDQEEWFESYLSSRRKSDFDQDINIICNQMKPIGVGGFTRIEWRNQRAELTFYIGEKECRTHAIILQCLNSIVAIGFKELNLHKITWPVYSHDPNLEVYKRLFLEEAVLEQEYWWDGVWKNRHYLSIVNT